MSNYDAMRIAGALRRERRALDMMSTNPAYALDEGMIAVMREALARVVNDVEAVMPVESSNFNLHEWRTVVWGVEV